jgi:alcohol-forming fatty acyl-CoA reductase
LTPLQIFDGIKETDKTYMDKITVVEGDLQRPVKMGLSVDDLTMIVERAEVIIHCAADVRFEESLKEAIETNVRGTKEMLMLARSVKNLNAFIYVSTAFSHCNRTTIGEEFYGSPQDPDTMIKLVSMMTETDCEYVPYFTEKIISPWPNTYAYTKVLAEEVMRIYGENMPVAIIRPSISE